MNNENSWLDSFGVEVNFRISHCTYCYGDYLFDIVVDLDKCEYGYWLYHKSCGIKSFMHGFSMNDVSYREFILTVISGLDEDIEFYDEHYNF